MKRTLLTAAVPALVVVLVAIAGPAGAVPTSTTGASAPAPAVSITSIAPTPAERGGLVEIRGTGFGSAPAPGSASRVAITLDGEPVPVLSATGSTATFRVPALAGPGRVEVRATNPGGRFGETELVIPFDGKIAATTDEEAATTENVGPAGGTIAVAGMTLAIPRGAVPEGETITVTPLLSLEGSPFTGTPVGVKLEPSGLVLLKPATLTLPRPAGAGPIVAFGFDGSGTDFHAVPHRLSGDTASVLVWHFSGAGITVATPEQLESVFGYEPTPAHMQAESRIAAALAAATTGIDPSQAIFDALVEWHNSSVLTGLELAEDGRLAFFELAFGEWQAWLGHLQRSTDDLNADHEAVLNGVNNNVQSPQALDTGAAQARRLLGDCTGAGALPVGALRSVLRLANIVNLIGLGIETRAAEDGTGRMLPAGPDLARACFHVEITDPVQHAPAFALDRENRVSAHAHVVFWRGSSTSAVPLVFKLGDTTGGEPVPIATETVHDGHFETRVRPTVQGQRRYLVQAELAEAASNEVLRAVSGSHTFGVPVRNRVELAGKRTAGAGFTVTSVEVPAGAAMTLRIRLAGDGVAGRTIAIANESTVDVVNATTNAQGEVLLPYTASTFIGEDRVHATLDEGTFEVRATLAIVTREPRVVDISPAFGFAQTGGTVQFTADVVGLDDDRVSWEAEGGEISTGGLFTAGNAPGTFRVTATSLAEPEAVGEAFVQVSSPVSITVAPATATLAPGQTRQFTATVTGTANTAVTWSATGGTIDASGLYTAETTPGTFSVTARSVADPSQRATATVTIAPASGGMYRGTGTQTSEGVRYFSHLTFGVVRNGDVLTMAVYGCNRRLGDPTLLGCAGASTPIVCQGVVEGTSITTLCRTNLLGEEVELGPLTGTIGEREGRLTIAGRYTWCANGSCSSVSFELDRVGAVPFSGAPEEWPVQFFTRSVEPWPYHAGELSGRVSSVTRYPDGVVESVTVSDGTRSLRCYNRHFPGFDITVGTRGILYCHRPDDTMVGFFRTF